MTRRKYLTLTLLPLTAWTILLIGCTMMQIAPASNLSFPPPTAAVEKELRAVCISQDTHENYCPATFEWLGRLHKLELKMKVQK